MSEGEWIFEQDEKTGWFWIKNSNYWNFLQSNFNLDWKQVKELTSNVVNDVLNCKQYATRQIEKRISLKVNYVLNGKQYSTGDYLSFTASKVDDILNCKQYTTFAGIGIEDTPLNGQ